MASSPLQLTVHVTAPAARRQAWRSWLNQGAAPAAATVVETPLAAAQLSRWLGAGRALAAHRVVAWGAGGVDAALWSAVLAPALAAVLPTASPYRTAPGAAAAVLKAALVAHGRRVPPARLQDLAPDLSEAMGAAWRLWDRVRWGAAAAAPEVPPAGALAVYGALGEAQDWVLSEARHRPVRVFLASRGRRHAPMPGLSWWERQGAQVDDARPDSPAAEPEPLRLAVRHPDDSRWAVDSVLRTDAAGDVLVVAATGRAAALARDLRGLGWRAAAHPAAPLPSLARAAWEASVERPPAAALLEWARSLPQAAWPLEVEPVFKNLGHPAKWPAPVRAAHSAMAAARVAMLAAEDWAAVGRQLDRWRKAAGASPGRPHPALALWDRAEVAPAPASVEAWVASELAGPGDLAEVAADVWVVESDAAAAGFSPSALIILDEARDPTEALDPDDVPAVLTERVRVQLGLAGTPARHEQAIWRRSSLAASAGAVVAVVVDPEAEARGVRPPAARGAGLGAALGRDLSAFSPFDGQFAPGAVPVPHSASGFERFGRCPLQYAWGALDIEPAAAASADPDPRSVGLWMHRVLAQAAAQVPPPPILELQALLEAAVREDPPAASVLPGLLAGRLEGLAADVAEVLAENPPPPDGHLETEWRWDLAWQGQELTGRMDRVEQHADGSVLVVDYKSGAVDSAHVNPTHLQLALYARAASERLGVPLDRVAAAYWGIRRETGFAKKGLEPPTAARWEEAEAIMAGVMERAAAGALYMFPTGGACRTCDYRAACPSNADALGRRKVAGAAGFHTLWSSGGEGGRKRAPD